MNEDKWANLTPEQLKILSVSGKIEKMEGVFTGWYYAALMTGNQDAARVAFDLKRDASIAHTQFIEIANASVRGGGTPYPAPSVGGKVEP